MRPFLLTVSLWMLSICWVGSARALMISDFQPLFQVELRGIGGVPATLTDTEAVAVHPNRDLEDFGVDGRVDVVWITGTDGGVGFIFSFNFDPFLLTLTLRDDPVAHAFGDNAEGLAYAGNDRLLVSNAPDNPTPASGVYQFDAETLTAQNAIRTDPANQAEGLAVDPADLGRDEVDLWIADESDDKVYEFDLEFASPTQATLEDDFGTDNDDDGFDRPEGVAVFLEDLLVVDDGRDGFPGRIVQFDEDGEILDQLSTGQFLDPQFDIFDPQGIDYDPLRNLIYIVNDGDLKIAGDVPTLLVLSLPGGPTSSTPEPTAAVAFATQLVVVAATFRARRRRRERRSRATVSGVVSR